MKKYLIQSAKNKKGAAVLITVIITMTIITIIALSLALSAISEGEISTYQSKATRVFANIDGCAEESLIRVKRKPSYTGETLTIDQTSCNIVVTGSGDTRTILITATNTNYTKILQLDVSLAPTFAITNWQELNN